MAEIIETDTTPLRDVPVDVVTLDLIENGLRNARYEMDEVLFRTALSPGIREQHDEFPLIADPVTGHRGHTVVDASPGLGEAVVSGAVNPDHFVVDSRNGAVLERAVGDKRLTIRARPGGGTEAIEQSASTTASCRRRRTCGRTSPTTRRRGPGGRSA